MVARFPSKWTLTKLKYSVKTAFSERRAQCAGERRPSDFGQILLIFHEKETMKSEKQQFFELNQEIDRKIAALKREEVDLGEEFLDLWQLHYDEFCLKWIHEPKAKDPSA